jgi:hypothetical protein
MHNSPVEPETLNNELNDLEPLGPEDIQGGQTREHILLARQTGLAAQTRVRGDWNGDGTVTSGDFQP